MRHTAVGFKICKSPRAGQNTTCLWSEMLAAYRRCMSHPLPSTAVQYSYSFQQPQMNQYASVQVIPHSFGRRRPPIILSTSMVDVKVEMCNVLSDITVAQDMLDTKQQEEENAELPPHPADEKYASLMADMEIIQPDTEEYRIIEKYCQARRELSIPAFAYFGPLLLSCRLLLWLQPAQLSLLLDMWSLLACHVTWDALFAMSYTPSTHLLI